MTLCEGQIVMALIVGENPPSEVTNHEIVKPIVSSSLSFEKESVFQHMHSMLDLYNAMTKNLTNYT